MKHQRGHFDFTAIYWLAVGMGAALTGGGVLLLVWGLRGLL